VPPEPELRLAEAFIQAFRWRTARSFVLIQAGFATAAIHSVPSLVINSGATVEGRGAWKMCRRRQSASASEPGHESVITSTSLFAVLPDLPECAPRQLQKFSLYGVHCGFTFAD